MLIRGSFAFIRENTFFYQRKWAKRAFVVLKHSKQLGKDRYREKHWEDIMTKSRKGFAGTFELISKHIIAWNIYMYLQILSIMAYERLYAGIICVQQTIYSYFIILYRWIVMKWHTHDEAFRLRLSPPHWIHSLGRRDVNRPGMAFCKHCPH